MSLETEPADSAGEQNADALAAAVNLASPDDLRELLRKLFDVQMRSIISTRMLPHIYAVGMIVGTVFTLYLVFAAFERSLLDGLPWLALLGPALLLAWIIFVCIVLELVNAVFRILVRLERVESTAADIAGRTEVLEDLPRITFWRGFSKKSDKGEPPPKS
jgi:hypothetical protein